MFVKKTLDCGAFIANDGCTIRELLHPENDAVDLPYSLALATVGIGWNRQRFIIYFRAMVECLLKMKIVRWRQVMLLSFLKGRFNGLKILVMSLWFSSQLLVHPGQKRAIKR